MINNKEEYRKFLLNNFKWLEIKKPLFYNWDIWIRFNLQWKETPRKECDYFNDDYFSDVQNKAIQLMESSFSFEDRVLVVVKSFKSDKKKIRKSNYIFKQFLDLDRKDIIFNKINGVYDSDDLYNEAIIGAKFWDVNCLNLLVWISYQDFFGLKLNPRIGEEVYFLNLSRNLIFHMYDDRGLDIIASDKNTLKPIYDKYNKWILNYDREKIDMVFK